MLDIVADLIQSFNGLGWVEVGIELISGSLTKSISPIDNSVSSLVVNSEQHLQIGELSEK